jgi:hypothetical protein
MTRKEIEKQIVALKKKALEFDYNGDLHAWREAVDGLWEDIERLEFLLKCASNRAATPDRAAADLPRS